jgi:hypothetical protein
MPDSYISDAMHAAVGRELGRRVSYPISASDIRRWAVAVYYPGPPPARFYDAELAARGRWSGIVAPEDFNPFAWMVAEEQTVGGHIDIEDNDPDFHELTLGLPSIGLKFQLNGGMEVEYGVPMRPADVITSVSRLAEYHERIGRLGLMLFTISEDTWTNKDGDLVKRSRSTLIRY